jgi:serine protease AprX
VTNSSEATHAKGASWGRRPSHGIRRRVAAALAIAVTTASSSLLIGGTAAAQPHDAAKDPYAMANMLNDVGFSRFWQQGYTGTGVDVALIDTGVAPVEGLLTPGKVIHGPDLSLESQTPQLTNMDTNGHGTFMAGLIAGKDSDLAAPYWTQPASKYRGVAPDARLVSLKVATADGGVDVTQMIAAINWVVDHKNDNGMNIRVLNLSYGTNSLQPYEIDPLAHAAERAWHAGIVVVAAAGNTGYQRGAGAPGLASPAYNPWVVAVGGYDHKGTVARSDDRVGSYSASANVKSARRPDFVNVGSKMQGLRVPGSFVDAAHDYGRLGDRYFRGSGTSEAAAITSGLVALLVQKFPWATPDEIKDLLTENSYPIREAHVTSQGRGAVRLQDLSYDTPWSGASQWFARSNGMGSIEISRGRDHLSRDGVELRGEIDIFGRPVLPGTSAQSWVDGAWNGSSWSGSSWSGSSWSGSSWSGSTWSGSTWSGSSWSGSSWSGSSWSGSTWSGSSWSGSSWSGSSWSGSSWSGSSWSGASWASSVS